MCVLHFSLQHKLAKGRAPYIHSATAVCCQKTGEIRTQLQDSQELICHSDTEHHTKPYEEKIDISQNAVNKSQPQNNQTGEVINRHFPQVVRFPKANIGVFFFI